MMLGSNREGGSAYLYKVSIKRAKVLKNFDKIHAEPINSMCINEDNLFTGSNNGA